MFRISPVVGSEEASDFNLDKKETHGMLTTEKKQIKYLLTRVQQQPQHLERVPQKIFGFPAQLA